ncbi:methyl-accepting chemotaxis protein [Tritonibacter horizontis]|uniref:Methyl-accepting chemotaxis protein III n=1 Tax=Tritonibacter horizontis TaxID=1768241 RepID=A0A132BUQ3_9RHOB|nr:methyl-accepting chemotaxis protein [Tritonibacter horizontis]KUP92119.1 methyl-accepting chemotaxis protein III [Tritonibacter horizontis]
MFRFSNLNLAKKLSLMIAIPAVVVVIALGALDLFQLTKSLDEEHETTYSSFVHGRSDALEQWLEGVQGDVLALTSSYAITTALKDFNAAWQGYEGSVSADLRSLYIAENPHPLGQKDELLDASDGSAWSAAHQLHHVGLRSYQRARGYYDLFLFDMQGNLVYSVFKEDDFGLNFVDGAYADSGLGEVFQAGQALDAGAFHMTDIAPYGPSAGAAAMFMSAPIFEGAERIGVVAVQVPMDVMTRVLSDAEILGETGEVYLVDATGKVLTNSRHEGGFVALDQLPERPHVQSALNGESTYFPTAVGVTGAVSTAMTESVVVPGGDRWGLIFEKDRAETMQIVRKAMVVKAVELAIAVVLLALLSWLAARSVARRIGRLSTEIGELAQQKYEREIPDQACQDEIGFISRMLASLQNCLRQGAEAQAREKVVLENNAQVVRILSEALMDLARGDFRNQLTDHFPEEHKKLRYSLNDAMDGLNEVVLNVSDTAEGINRGAYEISVSADELSSRTESQAATLEQTAAALEQVTVSVKSATEHVQTVEDTVNTARSKAEESSEIVRATIQAMSGIEQSSEQISQIISVIDDIAFQTNLLALNAGVEAARAGEAGRGFAVVASEVRGLAQRSSDAALEIKALIEKSGQQVGKGVEMVGRTGDALTMIADQVKDISGLIKQISQSSQEQSTALSEISTGMSQLDQVTQSNAAMVEENTAACHLLRTDAQKLSQFVGRFKTQDSRPIAGDAQPALEVSNIKESSSAVADVPVVIADDNGVIAEDWPEPEASAAEIDWDDAAEDSFAKPAKAAAANDKWTDF